ncbi:MAG: peptidoglycan DD-metalloendopeptidase family protein, partial [Firmicutes bacterium]|nr:peptidoglycan DD-metalloendopeptidase family protein [Bacillota bacterium]
YDYDAKLLASLEDQYEVINQEKQDLLDLKAQLLELQDEAEKKKASLEADQIAAAQKREQVQQSNKDLEAQIDAMKKEADALSAQIKLLQSSRAYVGGKMLWPSQSSTRVTSPFGNRLHPILKVYKLHTGIDIGAPNGTNILAANDGTVISAGYNNSYGYMVMLDHGGGIVTLYAHCSKLLVSKGDAVARGQVIALVGSTGMSTGPHLHFEVRINGVYKNPLEYVTP